MNSQLLKEFCNFCSININEQKINDFLESKKSKILKIDLEDDTGIYINGQLKDEPVLKFHELNVFTDGACSANGRKNAEAGIGIYFEEDKISISEKFKTIFKYKFPHMGNEKPTNNKAELLAILHAIDLIIHNMDQEEKIIHIKTDSMYSINVLTKWYKTWEKNNWKTANNKNVLNVEIIQKILSYVKEYPKKIKFSYVPAHKNKPSDEESEEYKNWYGNMMADQLAINSIN